MIGLEPTLPRGNWNLNPALTAIVALNQSIDTLQIGKFALIARILAEEPLQNRYTRWHPENGTIARDPNENGVLRCAVASRYGRHNGHRAVTISYGQMHRVPAVLSKSRGAR